MCVANFLLEDFLDILLLISTIHRVRDKLSMHDVI